LDITVEAVIQACPESGSFFYLQKLARLDTLRQSSDINNTMLNKFLSISIFINGKILSLLIALMLFFSQGNCQTKTNLEVFYSLTDSLVDKIVKEIPSNEKKLLLKLNLGESYSLFSNQIISEFRKNGKEIFEHSGDSTDFPYINIVMENAEIDYGEIFRDGWFGTHYVERYSSISGNYLQTFSGEEKKEFEISNVDTVKVEDIKFLENDSFPFTKGTLPSEPFISAFAEPLIAIGTAAAAVVLFFTIRSSD
jgi:hypothetical protein